MWKLTDRGRLVGPLLLVAFLGRLMADAARLRRAEPRAAAPPRAARRLRYRAAGPGWAVRSSLHESDPGPAVFAVTADAAASIGRDLVAIGRSLRRSEGTEPSPDRWAATVEIERRRRAVVQDEPDAAAQRQLRVVDARRDRGRDGRTAVARGGDGVGHRAVPGRAGEPVAGRSARRLLDLVGVPRCGRASWVPSSARSRSSRFSAGDFGLLLRPPAARIVGFSPHRAARSGVELLAARVLPPRANAGEVDLVAALLRDPADFARRYQRRPLAPPVASRGRTDRASPGRPGRDGRAGRASRVAGEAPVTPDLVVDGHRFDVVSPRTGDARQIAVVLEVRVVRGDATRFVLDLDESPVDLQTLRRQLDRFPIPGLETVVVVRGDQALRFFP